MNAKLIKKEGNKVNFEFEISWDVFEEANHKAYLKLRNKINIPGFRKGKAPKNIIEANYGSDVFYDEALNIILPVEYEAAVIELDIDPIDYPDFDLGGDIEKNSTIKVDVKVEVKPEITLGEYKGLEVEKQIFEVSDEMINDEIKKVQEMNARIINAENRAVKNGDILTIDYAGFVGDEQFEGGTAEKQSLEIGSGHFIPGFEEQLIAKEIGEEIEVTTKFPEEYHAPNLAGKDVIFKVKIHEIKEKEMPELDDEFAKDVSEFDTIEEYRNSIKENLVETFKEKEKIENENAVINKLLEVHEIDVPEAMIRRQVEEDVKNFDTRMRGQGFNLEQYLTMTNTDIEALKKQMEPMSKDRVKRELILDAIIKAENFNISDDEIMEEITRTIEILPEEQREDAKKTMYENNKEVFKKAVEEIKALQVIHENARFV